MLRNYSALEKKVRKDADESVVSYLYPERCRPLIGRWKNRALDASECGLKFFSFPALMCFFCLVWPLKEIVFYLFIFTSTKINIILLQQVKY